MTPATVLVTVTYGDRLHLLEESLSAAFEQGVARAVVVDNGATSDVAEELARRFGGQVQVERLPRNRGSAPAFARGLRLALQDGAADYILVLDDDNRLEPGALGELVAAHQRWAEQVPAENLMVQGARARQRDLLLGYPSLGMFGGSRSAFHGFHVADIPLKLWRRGPWGRAWLKRRALRAEVSLHVTSYSGLLFAPALLAQHGYPDERYLLYADDIDFTARVTRHGGRIVLIRDAAIVDIEESWNRMGDIDAFAGQLAGNGEFRAFYAARNTEYFEHVVRKPGWLRPLNEAVFMLLLWIRARQLGRQDRLALIRRAIDMGRRGTLGEDPAFPLE